jgi:hypothetical protein
VKHSNSAAASFDGRRSYLDGTDSRQLALGAALHEHKHPLPRYGYVLTGTLPVLNTATGTNQEYHPDFILDAVGQWHTGTTVGTEPVKLLVFDMIKRGKSQCKLEEVGPAYSSRTYTCFTDIIHAHHMRQLYSNYGMADLTDEEPSSTTQGSFARCQHGVSRLVAPTA